MGDALKNGIDFLFQPTLYFFGTVVMLALVLIFRKIATKKIWMWLFFVGGAVFMWWALDDPDFRIVITKPDNFPIVILIASVVYFTWLALRQAVINDELIAGGQPALEAAGGKKKVFTWPDLVYIEFICLILFTAFLIVWSLKVQAPIEEPAATARTPNPSKAPWYFLGLQEMLVYFDPWIAGVVLPGMIVAGLCAIPYVDTNPKGNGYYTFNERKFAWTFFMVGFLLFWISFVILGTFLRGPNWSFFGPFEFWDLHKLEPLVNVDLSTYFWNMVGQPKPASPLMREAPGIVALLGFFVLIPPLMAKTVFKQMVQKMGLVRFNIFMHLALWFALLPIKMLLRWIFNLKYIVGIPEWFFNV